MSIREALIHMFTDDPVNWLKWALVFAVLIGGILSRSRCMGDSPTV